jgi:hypothetical protein
MSTPPSPGSQEPAAPAFDATNPAAEARHDADRAWFLSNPALWPEHQQQVVAVYECAILGYGATFGAAYEAARQRCVAESRPFGGRDDRGGTLLHRRDVQAPGDRSLRLPAGALPGLFALGETPTAEQLTNWLSDRWLLNRIRDQPIHGRTTG